MAKLHGVNLIFQSLYEYRFDHLVANTGGLWKPRGEVCLYRLKLVSISIHVTKNNALAPVLQQVSGDKYSS
jgi:hypothetical protein